MQLKKEKECRMTLNTSTEEFQVVFSSIKLEREVSDKVSTFLRQNLIYSYVQVSFCL